MQSQHYLNMIARKGLEGGAGSGAAVIGVLFFLFFFVGGEIATYLDSKLPGPGEIFASFIGFVLLLVIISPVVMLLWWMGEAVSRPFRRSDRRWLKAARKEG